MFLISCALDIVALARKRPIEHVPLGAAAPNPHERLDKVCLAQGAGGSARSSSNPRGLERAAVRRASVRQAVSCTCILWLSIRILTRRLALFERHGLYSVGHTYEALQDMLVRFDHVCATRHFYLDNLTHYL